MRRTIGGSKPPRRWIWRRKGSTGSRARSQRRQRGSSGREQGGRRGLVTADGHHARVELRSPPRRFLGCSTNVPKIAVRVKSLENGGRFRGNCYRQKSYPVR
jgi:hypothetical protein